MSERGENPNKPIVLSEEQLSQLMKAAFMSGVGEVSERLQRTLPHELNQPISILAGYSELIRSQIGEEKPNLETLKEFSGEMVIASHQLGELVRAIARSIDTENFYHFVGSDLIRLNTDPQKGDIIK